jgi:hypothetical protein
MTKRNISAVPGNRTTVEWCLPPWSGNLSERVPECMLLPQYMGWHGFECPVQEKGEGNINVVVIGQPDTWRVGCTVVLCCSLRRHSALVGAVKRRLCCSSQQLSSDFPMDNDQNETSVCNCSGQEIRTPSWSRPRIYTRHDMNFSPSFTLRSLYPLESPVPVGSEAVWMWWWGHRATRVPYDNWTVVHLELVLLYCTGTERNHEKPWEMFMIANTRWKEATSGPYPEPDESRLHLVALMQDLRFSRR